MRFEVLCRNDEGDFEPIGSVILPYGAEPDAVRAALEGLDVYPRPRDTLHWLDEDLAGAAITNSAGGTIVILREVSAYRERTGYRPNDEELDWGQFLALDPFRGVEVETGKVMQLYSNEEHSPFVRAALYLETDYSYDGSTHQFVAWKRIGPPKGTITTYEMIQIPLRHPPTSWLDMGRWSGRLAREVKHQMQMRPSGLGLNNPFLGAAGASGDPKLFGLFFYWYLEATDWSFKKEDGYPIWAEQWQHALVDGEWLVQAYAGVFEVYERLASGGMAPESEVSAVVEELEVAPEPELAPRGRWTDKQIGAMRRRGLRPGYDFNGRRER